VKKFDSLEHLEHLIELLESSKNLQTKYTLHPMSNMSTISTKTLNMYAAARGGHVEALDALLAEQQRQDMSADQQRLLYVNAVKSSSIACVDVLVKHKLLCSSLAMDIAAELGDLAMLQHLHACGVRCTMASLDAAARNGHATVVHWLHAKRPFQCPQPRRQHVSAEEENDWKRHRALSLAIEHGHLRLAQTILELCYSHSSNSPKSSKSSNSSNKDDSNVDLRHALLDLFRYEGALQHAEGGVRAKTAAGLLGSMLRRLRAKGMMDMHAWVSDTFLPVASVSIASIVAELKLYQNSTPTITHDNDNTKRSWADAFRTRALQCSAA
jgi:hypothetical protein